MAAFSYTAINAQGKQEKGVAEADNERQVRRQLRERALVPLSVTAVKTKNKQARRFGGSRLSYADIALLTRQMATLLSAGMPLDEVLSGVAEQSEKDSVKRVLLGVRAKVLEGHSLAAGMADFPQEFPALYRTTVAAGERSGRLDTVLLRLAHYTEKQHRLRQKVKQAMIYPIMMTLVSLAIVVFLLIYVVPKIIHVFAQTKQAIPLSTTILVDVSHFVQHDGWIVLIALVALLCVFRLLLKQLSFKRRFHHFLLRVPVIAKTIRSVNCARFARTFGILNAATVPVLEAMESANALIVNVPMQEAVSQAIARVREGAPIYRALSQTHYFPPMFTHLVASGEQGGQLDSMLEKAADTQEEEVEALVQNALTLFEPILILIMGGVVLFIVLAIMLPIFSLDQYGG